MTLKQVVDNSQYITDEDIETFSDLSNISSILKRKETYKKAYSELRNKLFANL